MIGVAGTSPATTERWEALHPDRNRLHLHSRRCLIVKSPPLPNRQQNFFAW